MSISVQAGYAPLMTALGGIEPIGNPRSFFIKASVAGLPLINQALVARTEGKNISVRVILDVIASINPSEVAAAQATINNPPKPPSVPTQGPPPPPPPKPKPPIIGAEIAVGPPDDLFVPFRIYGEGFWASEAVALIQVLGGSQAPLAAAASDPAGRIDVTIDLASNSHYNVYAIGVSSNVPSNTIGIATP